MFVWSGATDLSQGEVEQPPGRTGRAPSMKKRIGLAVAVVALAFTATPARAHGPVGFKFNIGGSLYTDIAPICGGCCGNGCGGGGGGPLGPWYNYWPLEAHFQTPAMPEYPYWPAMGTAGEAAAYGHGGYTPPYWGH
jgi:hypothetical protein